MFCRTYAHILGVPLVIALGVSLAGVSSAHDMPVYEQPYVLYDLGTLGGDEAMPLAVNDNGTIVGWSEIEIVKPTIEPVVHAFLWKRGQMYDLGTLGGDYGEARGVNNLDEVVGRAAIPDSTLHAFVYTDGRMIDLNDHVVYPPEFARRPVLFEANAIADDGSIVGCARMIGTREIVGFMLVPLPMDSAEHMYQYMDLGKLHIMDDCEAIDLNESASVVGISGDKAFVWRNEKMVPLEPFFKCSRANAIDSYGAVVGFSADAAPLQGPQYATLWTGGACIDLAASAEWTVSEALDINDAGQIVGWATGNGWAPMPRAVVWKQPHDPKMLDEITLIPIVRGGFPWGRLEKAIGIDGIGRIVGYGCSDDDRVRGFVLIPFERTH